MSEEQDNQSIDPEDFVLFGDVTDFDLFKAQVQTLFITLSNEVEKRLVEKESRFEKYEEQLAMLYAAYVEQAAIIENILLTIFINNPEKEKIFTDNLQRARKNFLETLSQGASDVLAGEDSGTAAAIKNLVEEKLSD